MNRSNVFAAAGLAVFSLGATLCFAAVKGDIDKDVVTSLSDFNALHASNAGLRKQAAGVLVFPHITKGGVGVAGEFGEGALQVNGKTVGYYSIAGASVGLTLGAAKRSEIIMFMTQKSLDDFMAQMKQVKKLGPMGKVMQMIPGMSQLTKQMNMGEGDVERQMPELGDDRYRKGRQQGGENRACDE